MKSCLLSRSPVCYYKVSEKLLEGRVLEVYTWEGDPEKQLQGVREKLNMLSEVILFL